jgi:hypothetical protein
MSYACPSVALREGGGYQLCFMGVSASVVGRRPGCVKCTITMFLITLLPYLPIQIKIDKKELHFRAHFIITALLIRPSRSKMQVQPPKDSRPAMHTSFTDLKRNRS